MFLVAIATALTAACTTKVGIEPRTPNSPDQGYADAIPIDETTPILDVSMPMNGEVIDAGTWDSGTSDASREIIECGYEVSVISPEPGSFIPDDDRIQVVGQVDTGAGNPAANTTVQLLIGGEVEGEAFTNADGQFIFEREVQAGDLRRAKVVVQTPAGQCEEESDFEIFSCRGEFLEDFNENPVTWTRHGSATWDPGGWLDMTGPTQGQKGAYYNDIDLIERGLASIEFTIRTGNGLNGGADGFALTIVNLPDPDRFISLLDAAASGAGLGYAVGGAFATPEFNQEVEAITVEVDTWYNSINAGNRHTDPTEENHIAITQNVDASDHLAWFEVPNIEDMQDHRVRVDLLADRLRVSFDEVVVLEQDARLVFKGGYMFFSGSTGWASNLHIIDSVKILHDCR